MKIIEDKICESLCTYRGIKIKKSVEMYSEKDISQAKHMTEMYGEDEPDEDY